MGMVFYILAKGRSSFINLMVMGIFTSFALWSLGNSVLYNTNISFDSAGIILDLQAPGWIGFSSYYMFFVLYFTRNERLAKKPAVYVPLIIIPLILAIAFWNGKLVTCCSGTKYGLISVWNRNWWVYSYYIYYITVFLSGMALLINFRMKEKDKSMKAITNIHLVSMAVSFILGTFTSVILKETKMFTPFEGNILLLTFGAGVIYAIAKYDFLNITTEHAAGQITDIMRDGFILFDYSGRPVVINSGAVALTGLNSDELSEKISGGGFFPSGINEKIKAGAEIYEEFEFAAPEGSKAYAFLLGSKLEKRGQNRGYVLLMKDITKTREAEKKAELSVEELKRSNEELERFAYVASHDLKEPVRMISVYVQLLEKKYRDALDPDTKEYIKYASEGASRINTLINGLLEYSRAGRKDANFGPVDLNESVGFIKNALKFRISDRNADIKILGTLPVVHGDAGRLEQLIRNLIENGLKFNTSLNPEITISSADKPGFHVLRVADNGIGIKEEYLEKIFEIFQRLHSRSEYEGNGVGLSICRKIAEAHGGKIWAESGPDGSVFVIELPLIK